MDAKPCRDLALCQSTSAAALEQQILELCGLGIDRQSTRHARLAGTSVAAYQAHP
jgi:hypothetical protein